MELTTHNFERITRLVELLKEFALVEYEIKESLHPLNMDKSKAVELGHKKRKLQIELAAYKYYEVDCVNHLISMFINGERLTQQVLRINSNFKRMNKVVKSKGYEEKEEELNLFFILLISYVQANKEKFKTYTEYNDTVNLLIAIFQVKANKYGI